MSRKPYNSHYQGGFYQKNESMLNNTLEQKNPQLQYPGDASRGGSPQASQIP